MEPNALQQHVLRAFESGLYSDAVVVLRRTGLRIPVHKVRVRASESDGARAFSEQGRPGAGCSRAAGGQWERYGRRREHCQAVECIGRA